MVPIFFAYFLLLDLFHMLIFYHSSDICFLFWLFALKSHIAQIGLQLNWGTTAGLELLTLLPTSHSHTLSQPAYFHFWLINGQMNLLLMGTSRDLKENARWYQFSSHTPGSEARKHLTLTRQWKSTLWKKLKWSLQTVLM